LPQLELVCPLLIHCHDAIPHSESCRFVSTPYIQALFQGNWLITLLDPLLLIIFVLQVGEKVLLPFNQAVQVLVLPHPHQLHCRDHRCLSLSNCVGHAIYHGEQRLLFGADVCHVLADIPQRASK